MEWRSGESWEKKDGREEERARSIAGSRVILRAMSAPPAASLWNEPSADEMAGQQDQWWGTGLEGQI